MKASKPLIYGAAGVIGLGVGYDFLAHAGWIKGDGRDHTVSLGPMVTTTGQSISSITVVNTITGEETPISPAPNPYGTATSPQHLAWLISELLKKPTSDT